MSVWNEYHANPRISYYLYLRRGYRCASSQAHAHLKRMDAMVVGLQTPALDLRLRRAQSPVSLVRKSLAGWMLTLRSALSLRHVRDVLTFRGHGTHAPH